MIHYSCDRCRRAIDPEQEVRYSVQIEIEANYDSTENTLEEDRDHLGELNEMLDQFDDDEIEELSRSAYQRRQFDLCEQCHRQYIKNPLSVEAPAKLEFSDN